MKDIENLDAKEQKIMDEIATHPSYIKKFQKIYNKLCGRCTQMCLSNPSRPIKDYCTRCQKMMNKIIGV